MYASVKSAGVRGLSAELVTVEVDLSSGLPRFDLVGLPNSAVSESKERVRSAVRNCGFQFPISRITVNLAPADFRKEGPIYDLPIFTAMMLADHQVISGQKTLERKLEELQSAVFLGELSPGRCTPCPRCAPHAHLRPGTGHEAGLHPGREREGGDGGL